MTTREAFAMAALQGIVSNPTWNGPALVAAGIPSGKEFFAAAFMAARYADALLEAMTNQPPAREVEGRCSE